MYFWSVESVAHRLKDGSLSEWQKTKYYLATVLFGLFASCLAHLLPTSFGLVSVVSYAIDGVIAVHFVLRIFKMNHQADDKNFIERLICFGLPAQVKSFIFYFLISYLYYFISMNLDISGGINIFMHLIISPFTYILMFYFIYKGFRVLHA